jgi:hypothetical protein
VGCACPVLDSFINLYISCKMACWLQMQTGRSNYTADRQEIVCVAAYLLQASPRSRHSGSDRSLENHRNRSRKACHMVYLHIRCISEIFSSSHQFQCLILSEAMQSHSRCDTRSFRATAYIIFKSIDSQTNHVLFFFDHEGGWSTSFSPATKQQELIHQRSTTGGSISSA